VPGDEAAAVVADDRQVVEAERVDDAAHRGGVVGDADARGAVEPAVARADQVEHVAAQVRGEVGEQAAVRRPRRRPAVHEHHVGALAHAAHGDLAVLDLDPPLRWAAEQLARLGRGQRSGRAHLGSPPGVGGRSVGPRLAEPDPGLNDVGR
jgi:hypothetical protein